MVAAAAAPTPSFSFSSLASTAAFVVAINLRSIAETRDRLLLPLLLLLLLLLLLILLGLLGLLVLRLVGIVLADQTSSTAPLAVNSFVTAFFGRAA